MSIKFFFSGIKMAFYSFTKRIVDRRICLGGDYAIFAIHGTMMTHYNTFYPMQKFMDRNFIPLSYNFRDNPDDICRELLTKIKKCKKVIFIGHSYGGIIARYLVTKYLGDKKKYTIFTIASPNTGLDISKARFTDKIILKFIGTVKEELKDSRTIGYLKRNPLRNVKMVNIIGKRDTLVGSGALINGQKEDYELDEDHLSIIYSKDLFRILGKEINGKILSKIS